MNETVAVKQTKFSNGEISPTLYGDTSHPKYPSSLRTALNWLPIQQGALVKRPGTRFIAPFKDSTYVSRLIPFFFSDGQTFVLEVGNLYIRFYQKKQYVGNDYKLHTYGDSYAGGYYELVTIFTTAMLPYLKYSQVGDVVTICYGGQVAGVGAVAPQDLTHTTGVLGPWTIAATPTKSPQLTWGHNGSSLKFTPQAYAGGTVYNKGNRVTTVIGGATYEWIAIQDNFSGQAPPTVAVLNFSNTAIQGNLYWMPATDLTHIAENWEFAQTAIIQDVNGVVYESNPTTVTSNEVVGPDRPLDCQGISLALEIDNGTYTVLAYRFYRGQNGVRGWIGDIVSPFANFTDEGNSPDYSRQPPKNTDPFLVQAADSYPSVIGYLDQRRVWGASLILPATIMFSKAGDLYNYDRLNVPGALSDAFNVTLASEVMEQIRSFAPMRRGIVLTAQGEWAVSGTTGGPVANNTLDAKRQSRWGSSWLNPIIIGTGLLFNTAKSNMVRDLYPLYGLYADIWDGQDLSVMARHLLDLHTLKDWAFQSVPYPVIHMVRDDGALLSLTYQHAPPSFGMQLAEGIAAWAQHTTGVGNDAFESVCVVPEPPEDAVYVGVKRLVNGVYKRFIERFNSPICSASPYVAGVSDVRYGVYSDCSVQYDGHEDQSGFTGIRATIDSIAKPGSANPADYPIGTQVTLTTSGGAPFAATDAATPYNSAFIFDPENDLGLGPLKGHIVGYTDGNNVTLELDLAPTQAQLNIWAKGGPQQYQPAHWGLAKASISITQLAGYQLDSNDANGLRGLLAIVDGDVQVPVALTNGIAYFQNPGVVIQCGIAYNGDAALLDLYLPNAEIRNKFKNVHRIGFEIAGSRDLWAGPGFSKLVQMKQRQVSDAYSVMGLETGYFEMLVQGQYNKTGQAVLRHYQPLPAILSSVLREVRLGDS